METHKIIEREEIIEQGVIIALSDKVYFSDKDNNSKKKINISYVISLGSCCHTATFLKQEKLKLESYPFDWVFSGPKMNYEIMIDKFKNFLDKTQYTQLAEHRAGHKLYGHRFFNHKNPKDINNDYEYYVRCINRFYNVMNKKEHKLFIITNVIDQSVRKVIHTEEKEYTQLLCNYLKAITSNFSLIYIDPIKITQEIYDKLTKYYTINQTGNLYWITLYTLSDSDGLRFSNHNDNVNYKTCIYDLFDFNILKNDCINV